MYVRSDYTDLAKSYKFDDLFNPFTLRVAKTVLSFGQSQCKKESTWFYCFKVDIVSVEYILLSWKSLRNASVKYETVRLYWIQRKTN